MSAGRHLDEALAAESEAYSALLAGEPAQEQLLRARDAYLASHEESSATSWGRLIGALKMAILADDGVERIAGQAIAETDETEPSPASAYARSLAQLALGERPQVEPMLDTGDAFERTGRAMAALAAGDREQYNRALAEIVSDFAARDAHLSGVAVADTAMVLERLAAQRGLSAGLDSPLLPPRLTGLAILWPARGYSSVGRASRWQREGHRFEPG